MNYIELTSEEIVNVVIIDNQHAAIAEIVNNIHSQHAFQNEQKVSELLKNLIDELEIHFDTEETMMKENKFPGYITHKLEHDRFYNQILRIFNSYKNDSSVLDDDKIDRIKNWFFNHIEINDKKCGMFFNSVGIS